MRAPEGGGAFSAFGGGAHARTRTRLAVVGLGVGGGSGGRGGRGREDLTEPGLSAWGPGKEREAVAVPQNLPEG